VDRGVEAALDRARLAANGRNVVIMGGPSTGRQYLRIGLIDELIIHVAPVLFGAGLRLFEQGDDDSHVQLENPEVSETAKAVHLRYRVRT